MDYRDIPVPLRPSPIDDRDFLSQMFIATASEFENKFIVPFTHPVYDQGKFGMCNAFATAGIKDAHEYKERGVYVRHSPGMIYGNRDLSDWLGEGMDPRQGLKILRRDGVCKFDDFPIINDFWTCMRAFRDDYDRLIELARPQRVESYFRIRTWQEACSVLKETGIPILFAIKVYNSFYNVADGIIPDIQANEPLLGGHAMELIGWEWINGRLYYIVQNQWGTGWAKNGICWIPADYKGIAEMWGIVDFLPSLDTRSVLELWLDKPQYCMNGRYMNMDTAPVQINNRMMIPIRYVTEAFGAEVTWVEEERKAIIKL